MFAFGALLSRFVPSVVLVMASVAALSPPAQAAGPHPAPLAGDARPVIEQFLQNQAAGLPGRVVITIDTPMSGALPPCDALEPFLPGGARLWGRVSVGVRCNAGQPWTRYVPAYVAVHGNYYVAARPLSAGQVLTPADAAVREGDLTALPRGVVVDAAQFDGVTALNSIASGAPLRRESLRAAIAVQQGQNVRLRARGAGFTVSTEGKAMASAAAGALVQVRTAGGQLLSGIALADGTVERVR
ncbi:flagellar basal body P-ring formation chaperone FlgA [Polaromonas sp. LjRoot131]|uniref:flagellar basal body P-ring formation chaperone FlgA n=1 Tax=Polaromonas sp. LjRoot131 TaxID=3342262 RepID=UPI003ECEDE53